MNNPSQELMMAVGGRVLRDPARTTNEVVEEVLAKYYQPKNAAAVGGLKRVVQTAEESYFGAWSADRFQKGWGTPLPGEFKLDQRLFGTSPGPATHPKEPCLDTAGRKECRKGLKSILADLPYLERQCNDGVRLARIRRSVIITLNLLNTVCYCLGEPIE